MGAFQPPRNTAFTAWKHELAGFLLIPLIAALEEDIMKPFALLADRSVRWANPTRWKRRCELAAGDDVHATIEFEKACGMLAVARTSAQASSAAARTHG